jgi:WXXGXW repeat (2 copies)
MKVRLGLSFLLAALVLVGLVVTPATASAQVRVRVYAPAPPPAPVREVIGVAPSHRHAWVPGYHRWDGRAYAWEPGRWAVRPRSRARWMPGHWERGGRRGWYFVEGRWR